MAPGNLGSAAGHSGGTQGGYGGGLIILDISNTLEVAGTITANGNSGNCAGNCASQATGGGSGGGINIHTGTLKGGANSVIRANGGVGNTPDGELLPDKMLRRG